MNKEQKSVFSALDKEIKIINGKMYIPLDYFVKTGKKAGLKSAEVRSKESKERKREIALKGWATRRGE